MALTAEQLKRQEELKKLVDLILTGDPNMLSKEFGYNLPVRYWRSNNFLQHVMTFNRVYDPTNKQWRFIVGDSDGYLTPRTILFDRDFEEVKVIDAYAAALAEVVITAGVDVSKFGSRFLKVNTNANCNVYYQTSDDNLTWYDPKTEADANLVWVCNNEAISLPLNHVARYIRVVVQAVAAATITAVLSLQV